jgi:hypothetical protein
MGATPLILEVPVQEAYWETVAAWCGGWALGGVAVIALSWSFVRRKKRREAHSGPRIP